jgi:hypothetical protein
MAKIFLKMLNSRLIPNSLIKISHAMLELARLKDLIIARSHLPWIANI